jgi:hypothetical protein
MGDRSGSIFERHPEIFNGGSQDQPRPCKRDPVEAGGLVTVRAIRRFIEAREFHESMGLHLVHNTLPDGWGSTACEMLIDADSNLLVALLTWPVEGDPFIAFASDRPKFALRPRGVLFEGRLYAAIQDPEDGTPLGEQRADGIHVMKLAVIDMAHVIDLATIGGVR